MAVGLQRLVRRALLARLKADEGLTELVPTASMYTQAAPPNPSWPFIRFGPPTTLPLKAACVAGGTVAMDVHAFAGPRKTNGQTVETAEDHAGRIGAAIEAALADNRITLEGGGVARISISDMRLLQDEEPEAFHYFCQVNARVLAEAEAG